MTTVVSRLESARSENPHASVSVIVTATPPEPDNLARAQELARDLGLPFAPRGDDEFELVVTPRCLELRHRAAHRDELLTADFSIHAMQRLRRSMVGPQPLRRAVGSRARYVVDATAGLGRDTLLLACYGYRVTAIERCRPIAALVRDGLTRAYTDGALTPAQVTLLIGDARTWLTRLDPAPDAIYIDPMFPPKRRSSAASPKAMRIVRALAGDDADAATLLEAARACCPRVVVKRPDHAPPLAPAPTASYTGTLVRYDVYRTP